MVNNFQIGMAGKGRQRGVPAESRKGEVTREKILQAALQVFAEHPYKSASMRMIGKAGGFDHPLIHYYFPTKADLFEAVVKNICEEFSRANQSWFDGLQSLRPRDGLSLYVDRLLAYHFEHPEPLRVLMLNAAQLDRLEEIPGYQHLVQFLGEIRRTLETRVPLRADGRQVEMFLNSFNSLVVYLLGAATCQAQVLGLEPKSGEYRQWVKETLEFLFLPTLEKLLFPERGR